MVYGYNGYIANLTELLLGITFFLKILTTFTNQERSFIQIKFHNDHIHNLIDLGKNKTILQTQQTQFIYFKRWVVFEEVTKITTL